VALAANAQQSLFDERELRAARQTSAIRQAVEQLANAGCDERGAVYTKRSVVDFILDLSGYTADRPLLSLRILEPCFGRGDFLLPIAMRLLDYWKNARKPVQQLYPCIRAIELHHESFEHTRQSLHSLFKAYDVPDADSEAILEHWLGQEDFLLSEIELEFDCVVGNPPYVRQERIPTLLLEEYRVRFSTMFDRADLYIPFFEKCLSLLCENGTLGFICADRWLKNRYGGPLRQLISDHYHLRYFVDMVRADAFESDVSAYPAITVISKSKGLSTCTATAESSDTEYLLQLKDQLLRDACNESSEADRPTIAFQGAAPWILTGCNKFDLIRRLEQTHPALEQAGCKVGIGVATGADKVFIAPFEELDIEDSRKLPLATTRDIQSGKVQWLGTGIVNPFDENGLVSLKEYPRLASYFEKHKTRLQARHVAKKSGGNWYRTIDRITPSLASCPKLLIPDIKGDAHVVYEDGKLYPHHNLYYVVSNEWDLHALLAVLSSGIAKLFVEAYSTKMRGGYFRFQAQYLRRICLPLWAGISKDLKKQLVAAGKNQDKAACNELTCEVYGLSRSERDAIL
jgi:hypothetical protein